MFARFCGARTEQQSVNMYIMGCAVYEMSLFLTHLPLDKLATISQTIISDAFSWMKMYFDENFSEVCSLESNFQLPNNGLDNGLAPNRRQAIIWTNVDPIHWRIYAALGGGDELMKVRIYIHFHICSSWKLQSQLKHNIMKWNNQFQAMQVMTLF